MAPATVYLETTVLSYLTAHDARDEFIAAHQRVTRTWWECERQQYRVVASAVVVREASAGDPGMAAKRLALLLARGLVLATVPNDAHVESAASCGSDCPAPDRARASPTGA